MIDEMELDNRPIEFYSVLRDELDKEASNQEVTSRMGKLIYTIFSVEENDVIITTFDILDLVPDQATRKFSHLTRLLFRLANDDRIDRIRFHSQLVKGSIKRIEEWQEGGVGFTKEEDHYIWYKPDILRWQNRYDNLEEAANAIMKMEEGMHRVYSKEGVLECGRSEGTLTIDFIEIWEEYRGQGRWSELLRHIAAQSEIKEIVVFMVCDDHMNRIMKNIQINDRPFIDRGCEYVWSKDDSD